MPQHLTPKLLKPRLERRAALAAGLSFALTLSAPAWAQAAFDLQQLTQLLSQVKSGDAAFTEKRTVSILAQTLESSGRLSFAAPDTFVRETLKPRREKVAVVGNSVTMSAGSRSRTVPLDSVPEAAVIMEAIRGTLTGNREQLERHFSANVSGNAQRWLLELVPIEPRLQELVRSVNLAGQLSIVREVTVIMADGDRSVMSIEPLSAPSSPAKPASAAS
ncbi:MAG: LolA-related protein [Rhizobacter sp.]